MGWEVDSTSKIQGKTAASASIGGGSSKYSGDSEHLKIAGRSKDWYVGVVNNSSEADSDFFIGKSSQADSIFNISQDTGYIGIGTNTPTVELDVSGTINATALTVNGVTVATSSSTYWSEAGSLLTYSSNPVNITNTTDSSSADGLSGALRTTGGASIAKKLYVGTDLDVDGTTHLDAVDIDGAVQIDGTVSVGVDGTGKDVTFFGDTADRKMLWDESEDKLYVYSASSAYTWLNGNDIHFDGAGFNTIDASTQLQFDIDANLKALLSSGGLLVVSPFTVGTTTTGYDVNIYGTDSGQIFWDQSTPELEITKALVDMNLADHAFDLDTTSGSISMSTTTGGMTLETTDNSALTINSASTSSSAAIDINATAGGIDVDAANTIAIDTSSGTIDIGTAATTAISIGNTTSEVTVNDNLKVNGSLSVAQFAEATTDDGTTAISAANIARKIIKCTPSADRSKATDTASNIISTCALTSDNDSIDFSIINLATDGTSFITVTAGSGVTLVGSMIVSAQDSAEDAFTSGVGMFRARRTGSSAITLYRIG